MVRPNGLIGTPNGRMLYVADAGAGKTYAYQVNRSGTLTDRKLFASEGSDGMTIDNKGNVYLSTKVVAVYNKRGKKIEEIPVPEQPTNLTFAGADNNTLFITARTSLYAVDMRVSGAATPSGVSQGVGVAARKGGIVRSRLPTAQVGLSFMPLRAHYEPARRRSDRCWRPWRTIEGID